MKKLIALLMALTMVAMMAACSTGTNNENFSFNTIHYTNKLIINI